MNGVPVRRHFIGAYIPVLHEICYLASFACQLIVRRVEYDIVHVFQTHLSAFVASVIGKRLGKKVITTSHGARESGDMAVWARLPMGKRLLATVRSRADAATAVSRDVMDELRQAGFHPERIQYIPNGVSVKSTGEGDKPACRSKLGLPQKAFVAVFVGRLTAEKAPGFLLSAWPTIRKKRPDSILLFLGEGPERTVLEERARLKGLQGAVRFSGRVDNVNDYLGAVDAFMLPSVTEGMSLALLEAMAAGLPVVATRVSGTVDVIQDGENGLLFDPGDKEGLVRCLDALMRSGKLRRELGEKARETVKHHFSLENTVESYLSLYQSIMS
jgi:glycosyltransferase involved in cell wall biosynthesis